MAAADPHRWNKSNQMTGAGHGSLMFRCPTTGEAFDSGFRFSAEELRLVPAGYSIKLRCKSCLQLHEFKLNESWIAQSNGKGGQR
jgi:hypothetical protein